MKVLAMVPARLGSQRLKQKNLREIGGVPLITHAIRKCKQVDAFDEIWVNAEHATFGEITAREDVLFHMRPAELASNTATSEDYIYEFLKVHPCDCLFQVHTIAPLLTVAEISGFVKAMLESNADVQLCVVHERIECAIDNKPLNFAYDEKTNSQDLRPIQRITWSITGWKADTYVQAYEAGKCATYAGKVGYFPVSRLAGHIIKTQEDLDIARALYPLVHDS